MGPLARTRPSEASFGIVLFKDVMVPMRDGIDLATDVYRPASNGELMPGTWPTILWRTSYNKESAWLLQSVVDTFVPNGYAVVIQDQRGRYRSGGKGQYYHVANPTEGADGFDTIAWIAAQPWSDGQVGTVGVSHGAMVQGAAALQQPPALKAMFIEDGPFNWFTNGARQGGACEFSVLGMAFLHAIESQETRDDAVARQTIEDAMVRLRELVWPYRHMAVKPGVSELAAVPSLEETFFNYYTRGTYDDFWRQDCFNYEEHLDRYPDIPVVLKCGWYDSFTLGTTQYYVKLREKNRSRVRLIYGPWVHGAEGYRLTHAGDVDFGPEAAWDGSGWPSLEQVRLRWFDRWLKGMPGGTDEEPPVLIFVMGGGDGRRNREGRLNHGGRWRQEQEWPLARTKYTPFYLGSNGSLSTTPPMEASHPRTFEYDPRHPVPTINANLSGFNELLPAPEGVRKQWASVWSRMRSIVPLGASHQKEEPHIVGCQPPYLPLAARSDVLVFQTEPLQHDVEVTGPIMVKLWVSSSALDTDFTAKLIDVYPPSPDYPQGHHMNLTDSIIRMRYRNGYDQEALMNPGEVYSATIELAPTSNLFKAGHRIRLDISSSNFPRFDTNPNTGEAMGRHTHAIAAINTVYCDPEHPSHIVLPQVP